MLSKYEIENVILSEQYTTSRKILTLNSLSLETKEEQYLVDELKNKILGNRDEDEVLKSLESEDSEHWVQYYGHRAAADLITLGKVQPETMLSMSLLPEKDFARAIKTATSVARKINEIVISAENELNMNLIPEELV